MRPNLLSCIVFCLLAVSAYSQQLHDNINHELSATYDKELYGKESNFHTSIKPYYHHETDSITKVDSLNQLLTKENRIYLTSDVWWAKFIRWSENKLLDEDLIKRPFGKVNVRFNPAIDLGIGRERVSQARTWQNTRGFTMDGSIGKKFFFHTGFFENQALFLPHITNYSDQTYVIPGQGRWKHFGENNEARDYGYSRASVVYKANETFTFQLGHGKNFIGDGYRSLILSDNALNYPFFKVETNFWNIKYVNLIAQFNHLGFISAEDRLLDKKWMAAQYLSWNITKRINFSLFEVVSWRAQPTRNFDINYINPLIFLRPVEFQNGSEDKMMIGATSKIKVLNKLSLYGQLVIDDLNIAEFQQGNNYWGNKYGIQAGMKAFDLFKIRGLSFQAEYNTARPYMYTHSDSINTYSHLNEALAHPLGANFQEGLAFLRYNYKRHFVQLRASYAAFGVDTAGINHGQNIFYSYNTNKVEIEGENGLYGHTTLQGDLTTLTFLEAKYGFMLNPMSKLMFEFGYQERRFLNSSVDNNTRLLFFGVKTTLNNFYYDFL